MNSNILPYGSISSLELLGQRIRSKRRLDGLTQQDLAALVGVGTRVVSDIENGKATAEIGKVAAILQGLGLRVELHMRGYEHGGTRAAA